MFSAFWAIFFLAATIVSPIFFYYCYSAWFFDTKHFFFFFIYYYFSLSDRGRNNCPPHTQTIKNTHWIRNKLLLLFHWLSSSLSFETSLSSLLLLLILFFFALFFLWFASFSIHIFPFATFLFISNTHSHITLETEFKTKRNVYQIIIKSLGF